MRGDDITIVGISNVLVEALRASTLPPISRGKLGRAVTATLFEGA